MGWGVLERWGSIEMGRGSGSGSGFCVLAGVGVPIGVWVGQVGGAGVCVVSSLPQTGASTCLVSARKARTVIPKECDHQRRGVVSE